MKMSRVLYILPLTVSVIFHAVLIVVVTHGWESNTSHKKIQMPRFVEAKLVQLKASSEKKQKKKATINKVDLTKKRKEQERLRAEAEKKRAKQALKVKKDSERKKKELKKKEREKKEKLAELERQSQLEKNLEREREREKLLQKMEEDLASEVAEEDALLLEEQYAVTAQSYSALIAARIEQNWSRPPSARTGMQCELVLQLVPTGQVINVDVSKSSNNAAFDRSAVQAVKKVERFEEIQKVSPQVFERHFRQFKLVFNPKDLRQ